jgi:hypothetical protein
MQWVGGVAEHVDQLVNNLTYSPLVSLLLTFSNLPAKETKVSRADTCI